MQEKFWNHLVQVKSSIYYLDVYAEESYRWDRRLNVFSAIASSSSIAAWAIWKEWSYAWAIIIAISQVLIAVKEYFPFSRRLKMLRPYVEELKMLYVKMEYDWYKVSEGELSESEINTLLFSYKEEYMDIENRHSKEDMLLENSKYMNEADRRTDIYFEKNFSI